MAKSDAFYIRGKVTSNGTTFAQSEIDLGSFVNLGVSKSTLLRIHTVETSYTDNSDVMAVMYYDGVPGSILTYQLTTQTQSAIVTADDKSVVARGTRYQAALPAGFSGGNAGATNPTETDDINPSQWKAGYLIGVDSLFFGTDASNALDSGNYDVSIILECTLETATQASSTALALSQQ